MLPSIRIVSLILVVSAACATAPVRPSPDSPVPPPHPDITVTEEVAAPPANELLVMEVDGPYEVSVDGLSATLTMAGVDADDETPTGRIVVTAQPFATGNSAKITASTVRFAYAQNMTVKPLRYDAFGSFAFFEYEGARNGGATPVRGVYLVRRQDDDTGEPAYMIAAHGEWPAAQHETMNLVFQQFAGHASVGAGRR